MSHENIRGDISWLEDFYSSLTNGDWEHSYGIRIDTLDNPGWSFECDLQDTQYEKADYSLDINRSENDWLRCWIDKEALKFRGACGPRNLTELIAAFRVFSQSY